MRMSSAERRAMIAGFSLEMDNPETKKDNQTGQNEEGKEVEQ
jgi:hypothetical protein